MIYDWYKIFNLTDFLAKELPSINIEANLEGVGLEQFMITKGNEVSIVYKDVMLPINYNNENPYNNDIYAVFLDEVTQNVWFGILVVE